CVTAWRLYEDAQRRDLNDVKARAVLAGSILNVYVAGELSTLQAIAQSPAMVHARVPEMHGYFERVQPSGGKLFTGGVGWADSRGTVRASNTSLPPGTPPNLAYRSYFKQVMTTGKPYVSEGILTRRKRQEVVVLAVPTKDAAGKPTGVLVGALLIKAKPQSK